MSEVSDVEVTLWREYQDDGLLIWAISEEDPDVLRTFRDQTGITFPVLHDEGGLVYDQYALDAAFDLAAFPQEWVIGPGNVVIYANNRYEPDEIEAAVQRALEEE